MRPLAAVEDQVVRRSQAGRDGNRRRRRHAAQPARRHHRRHHPPQYRNHPPWRGRDRLLEKHRRIRQPPHHQHGPRTRRRRTPPPATAGTAPPNAPPTPPPASPSWEPASTTPWRNSSPAPTPPTAEMTPPTHTRATPSILRIWTEREKRRRINTVGLVSANRLEIRLRQCGLDRRWCLRVLSSPRMCVCHRGCSRSTWTQGIQRMPRVQRRQEVELGYRRWRVSLRNSPRRWYLARRQVHQDLQDQHRAGGNRWL